MVNSLRSLTIAIVCLFSPFLMGAQGISDPTHWTFEMKKMDKAGTYQMIFHVRLDEGWHIFSQQPGDESLLPPKFHFEGTPVKLVGKIEEKGSLKTATLEGIDNPVRYYEGDVEFTATVHLAAKGKFKAIKGEYEYQVCTDRMCLAPKTGHYTFEVPE